MQLVINTIISPHFVALLDDRGGMTASTSWETPRQDGQQLADFITQQRLHDHSLSTVSICTGPGGFSSTRVGLLTAQALASHHACPLQTTTAQHWISAYAKQQHPQCPYFTLASFSGKCFLGGHPTHPDAQPLALCDLPTLIGPTPTWVGLLPPSAQSDLTQLTTAKLHLHPTPLEIPSAAQHLAQTSQPQPADTPPSAYYVYPAVQS